MNKYPSSLPEEDLLFLRFRDTGDERCFTRLFLLVEPWILRVLHTYVKDEADARDALQSAWMSMLQTRDRFDPARGSFRKLFCTIAVNAALQILKKNKRSLPLPTNSDGTQRDIPESNIPEIHKQIPEALSRLREEYRTVIDLYYFAGFEVREIALMMNSPEGTIKSWLTRARAQLGRLLGALAPLYAAFEAVRLSGLWN